ncbi:MAG: 50S ribosomal protein L22 [Candidatus Omnitrophica bacterium]|nr:50S ribosomal protein L22 [Candidatus Omnitrophota bacterium]
MGRFLRVSPRKVRQVLRLIQGLEVPRAQAVLAQTNRGTTRHISRVLKTAVASAAQRAQVGPETLRVTRATADEGPIGKRFRAGTQGRAMSIRKRTCHLRIELDAVRS